MPDISEKNQRRQGGDQQVAKNLQCSRERPALLAKILNGLTEQQLRDRKTNG